jgi:hypothetical protein
MEPAAYLCWVCAEAAKRSILTPDAASGPQARAPLPHRAWGSP